MFKITDRIDLNLGYTCNINCRFCYYQKSLKSHKDLTTQEAKKWLKFFYEKGKRGIELTGGEPTIRKDIFELIRYAKELGYKKICIITNGIKTANPDFFKQLVENGLNEILISIHGHTEQIHESLTCVKGSFEKVLNSIMLSHDYGIRCRTNTVVNGVNFKYVTNIGELLNGMNVRTMNFIMFNPIVEAQNSDADMNVSYSEASPFLKKVIDTFKRDYNKIIIRYIPFCIMKGYERFVTNMPQIQYDPDEWDYYLRTYFREGRFIWLGATLFGFLFHPTKSRLMKLDFYTMKRESVKFALIFKNKKKGKVCKKCAYEFICDGLWKDYADKKGFAELDPISGEKIYDPTFFFKID